MFADYSRWSCCRGVPTSRVSPRRARYFSLRRQRKVPKRKATRWSGTPALRSGATCGARRKRGLARTRLRLRQSLALIRFRLRSSAQPDGWGARERGRVRNRAPAGSRKARPRIPESAFIPKSRLTGPSSADGGGVKGGSCLSEASSDAPRRNRAAQVARSEAKGPGQSGRLFFGDFLLAKQKKVTCRRATPGLLAHPRPSPKVGAATCSPSSIGGYGC